MSSFHFIVIFFLDISVPGGKVHEVIPMWSTNPPEGWSSCPTLFELLLLTFKHGRYCETGPTVYSSYPRRIESLTNIIQMKLQRQHFLLSYFETLSDGLAGLKLAISYVTAQCSNNWATGVQFWLACSYFNYQEENHGFTDRPPLKSLTGDSNNNNITLLKWSTGSKVLLWGL